MSVSAVEQNRAVWPIGAALAAAVVLPWLPLESAVLLIIAWWARHWQRSRRTKQAAHHVRRHPASSTHRPDESDVSNETSPDAAASTLPPS